MKKHNLRIKNLEKYTSSVVVIGTPENSYKSFKRYIFNLKFEKVKSVSIDKKNKEIEKRKQENKKQQILSKLFFTFF